MVMRSALLITCFFALLSSNTVHGVASTWPAPIPLIHKSPYFNVWVDASTNVSNSPAHRWPQFFHRKDLGWFIGIRVDNINYMLQGDDNLVNYTTAGATVSTNIMPTQTRFSIAAGPVSVNLTYLTPIELQDWTLHSFPFAYAAFDIMSSDGTPHAIQLYTDTAAQFVSLDDANIVTWNTSFTAKSMYHMVQQRTLQTLTESDDMSEDGSQIFACAATPGVSLTWQTCSDRICRSTFSLGGKLENTSDTTDRAISKDYPVLAYALDLGNITRTSNTLVFGLGLIRDPVVSYRTSQTTQSLSHLWYSRWGNIGSAVDDFLSSYSAASARANTFDDRIQFNASSLASQLRMSTSAATRFVDLHILSLRQTVGSLEFTTSSPRKQVVMDDVRVFMKDVGYSRRTNPVEILYASFPAFLFLNTTLAGKLLEPLLEFQDSSLYRNDYAAPDLGNNWPIIQGNATDQSLLAIDSSGAMLIMALAHARKSGDGMLLYKYHNLLRKWADYLVQSTKQPGSYMSSDGLYSSNANLALKGIMGLYAMGKINNILEARGADASKTSYYLDTARDYAQVWLSQAVSSDHVMASFGSNSTWAMIYNLFAPRLLGATIIPEQIYETQASWYASRSGSAGAFGLPFDGTQPLAKAHWTLFSAGSVFNATASAGRDGLISMVHSRSFYQAGSIANPASYLPTDGSQPRGAASPAMGAIYSLLALGLPDLTITLPAGSLGTSGSTSNVPVIVGATIGSLAGLVLIATVVYFLRRHKRQKSAHIIDDPLEEFRKSEQGPSNVTPFREEIRPLVTHGLQGQNAMLYVQNADSTPTGSPETFRTAEKFSMMRSPGPTPQTVMIATPTDSSVAGGGSSSSPGVVSSRDGGKASSDDNNLRQEVEQLRRQVETLSAQQQPQLVYQPRSGPDDPPPMYPD